MNKFDENATDAGEDADPGSYKGPSSSIHYRPPAANYTRMVTGALTPKAGHGASRSTRQPSPCLA